MMRILALLGGAAFVFGTASGMNAAEARDLRITSHESEIAAQFESLSDDRLKDHYLDCSRGAVRRTLDWGEVALCSIAYETMLRRTFGGDFDALLTWSRAQRSN